MVIWWYFAMIHRMCIFREQILIRSSSSSTRPKQGPLSNRRVQTVHVIFLSDGFAQPAQHGLLHSLLPVMTSVLAIVSLSSAPAHYFQRHMSSRLRFTLWSGERMLSTMPFLLLLLSSSSLFLSDARFLFQYSIYPLSLACSGA